MNATDARNPAQRADRTATPAGPDGRRREILARRGFLCCGAEFSAARGADGAVYYAGADRRGQAAAGAWRDVSFLACGPDGLTAVTTDGALRAAGAAGLSGRLPETVAGAVRVSCGPRRTAVLLENGRVEILGDHPRGDGPALEGAVDLCCGARFTAVLLRDGTVRVDGGSRRLRRRARRMAGIAGVLTDFPGLVLYGITEDGRLVSDRRLPRAARAWRDLVHVSSDGRRLYGIDASGRLRVSDRRRSEPDGAFVASAASPGRLLLLTWDGRVRAEGRNDFGQRDTGRFGPLFSDFGAYRAALPDAEARREAGEAALLRRLSDALRCRRLLACGERMTACLSVDGRALPTADLRAARAWRDVCAVSCGRSHLLALRADGRVCADGTDTDGCLDTGAWRRVKAVMARGCRSFGLAEDGRVYTAGPRDALAREAASWTGIRRIVGTEDYLVGEALDGSLRAAGRPPFDPASIADEAWRNPAELAASATHLVCLRADGTVLTTVPLPGSPFGACDTSGWRNIRAVRAGEGFVLGVCRNGRVLCAGRTDLGLEGVAAWRGIADAVCGRAFAVGLRADGRTVAAGALRVSEPPSPERERFAPEEPAAPRVRSVPCGAGAWEDVLALQAGPDHVVALRADGRVSACGSDTDGQCAAASRFVLFRGEIRPNDRGLLRAWPEQPASAPAAPEAEREEACLPFALTAPRLAADAEALRRRLCGSERHLTALRDGGEARTYLYGSGRLIVEEPPSEAAGLAAGRDGTILLCRDGRARIRTFPPEPDAPEPDESREIRPETSGRAGRVVGAAFGDRHRVLLLDDGSVLAFGANDQGQCDVSGWRRVRAVAAGAAHTAGLTEDGTVVAVGGAGAFRSSVRRFRSDPADTEGWTDVSRVLCAGGMTLALRRDGTALAAGDNTYGQCRVSGWRGIRQAAVSGYHTVALTEDGRVLAAGRNLDGECETADWRRVIQIDARPGLTLALRADGRVLAAGRHGPPPPEGEAARAAACFGTTRQAFVLSDGSLFLSGREGPIRTGLSLFTPSPERSALSRLMPDVPWPEAARALGRRFALGAAHVAWLLPDGRVATAGSNADGQRDTDSWTGAVGVSAGPFRTAAVLSDGRAVMTGRRRDAETLNRALDGSAWTDIACGRSHTAALRADGRVRAVGEDPDGRCATADFRNAVAVACGARHTAVLFGDGRCAAVGDNRFGQCDLSSFRRIVLLACGAAHTVGLDDAGRLTAVGDNRFGQCDVGDLDRVVSVACLPETTVCVHADGRVTVRGGRGAKSEAAAGLREAAAAFGCEHRAAVLTSDGRLVVF